MRTNLGSGQDGICNLSSWRGGRIGNDRGGIGSVNPPFEQGDLGLLDGLSSGDAIVSEGRVLRGHAYFSRSPTHP